MTLAPNPLWFSRRVVAEGRADGLSGIAPVALGELAQLTRLLGT